MVIFMKLRSCNSLYHTYFCQDVNVFLDLKMHYRERAIYAFVEYIRLYLLSIAFHGPPPLVIMLILYVEKMHSQTTPPPPHSHWQTFTLVHCSMFI